MLMECLNRSAGDWEKAFATCAALRKPNAEAIADMAYDNFIEMRDKTASPIFRTRKKIEHGLQAMFPRWFLPLYNMISFSTIPYAEARARARRQSMIIGIAVPIAAVALIAVVVVIMRLS